MSMNRALLAILFMHFATPSFSQVITGTVLDQETHKAIDFASLHFDGTFVGTTTDSLGYFELDVSKYVSRRLTVSAVGYYSNAVSEFTPGESQQVYLKRRIFEIEEVSVSTKSLVRKRKDCLRVFRKEFIGFTRNARRCFILNEEDISFNYGSDDDTLRAYASKPLHIDNQALAYDITYYLDQFEYVRETHAVRYTGSIVFNQDMAEDEKNREKFLRRRSVVYSGSCRHFFRALWTNSLKISGFSVQNYNSEQQLFCKQIVFNDSLDRKYLQYAEDLAITYGMHIHFISYIRFLEEKVYFDQDGFFDPAAILWTGTMATQRIADFLPYEYGVTE
jgi:hypothetical protein